MPASRAGSQRSITIGIVSRSSGGWRPRCSTFEPRLRRIKNFRALRLLRAALTAPCSTHATDRGNEEVGGVNQRVVTEFQLRMGLTREPAPHRRRLVR
jgi:hypothetical protein